jgi:hypothetical protein
MTVYNMPLLDPIDYSKVVLLARCGSLFTQLTIAATLFPTNPPA